MLFYDMASLIQQYKSHVLCLLEQSFVTILHAAQVHLYYLIKLELNCIRELILLKKETVLAHHLAPLELRRCISALCFLHKIQLSKIHATLHGLFPNSSTKSQHKRDTDLSDTENSSTKLFATIITLTSYCSETKIL